ncbi:hypothetical protein ABTM90_20595, partial [Acinetobacter baumannii]
SGLIGQKHAHIQTRSDDGLTPSEQLVEIFKSVDRLTAEQQRLWNSLRKEMNGYGIGIVEIDDLTHSERVWLEQFFLSQ